MIANYHTHTWRCNHAEGTEEEYCLAAMERGLQTLGFSDHTPYIFPGDYYSTFRMRMEQYDDYVQTVLKLREKYRGKLQIPLGLEAEYYPKYFPELLAKLRDSPLDYLILGQHFVGNEELYSGAVTEDAEVLSRYCRQVMDAMNTGLFSYVAHPDILRYVGEPRIYRQHMLELCREAKNVGIPLEINLLGLRQNRWYPGESFWALAAEAGCEVVYGIDAHAPWHLLERPSEERADAIAEKYGLSVRPEVDLRPI